jgi:hypothetical protein
MFVVVRNDQKKEKNNRSGFAFPSNNFLPHLSTLRHQANNPAGNVLYARLRGYK